MTFKVTFRPDGRTAEVIEGTTVADAARAAGVIIAMPCGGRGRCGRCIVTVGDGITCGEHVLACQTKVDRDMVVTVPFSDDDKVIGATDHRRIDVKDLSPMGKGYGLAVDIGTTTVAVDLLFLDAGTDMYQAADMNRQRIRGEDVLTRMQYAADGGTAELQRLVRESINDLLDSFERKDFKPEKIKSVYIAGNTVMTHLFMGVDPSPIRRPPYEPVFKRAETTGDLSGLHISPQAKVVCMPSIASYVGGDVTSDIVDSGMDQSDNLALLIDVGTNGEVALGDREMMMTCSSSAGPAFEGGGMSSGMLAKPGAIDSVKIHDGKISFTVIGGGEPRGICGSGIIDLVAQLAKAGMLDRRGNFTEISGADDGVLRITNGVSVTQDDIQNVIMTKAAIYSAASTMVRNLGVGFGDVSKVYIAGGFGNFINMESAIAIGLFPDVDRSKYVYLGNASLAGAKYALLSRGFRDRVDAVFSRMTYVDLSSDPAFYDEYMSAQFLPHTDRALFPSVQY
jgi:uncharacterized 2Fe-2S/4Fe-4S cluster protein (DUF4445 family)